MEVKIVNKSTNQLSNYATAGSAGMDIRANLPRHPFVVQSGQIAKIPTGIHIELPEGYEAQIRPRSGLSAKGIDVKLGTIDSDYRGEINVIIHNVSAKPYIFHHGDRVAQMVIAKYEKVELKQVDVLSPSERGTGGFGHTGIK